MQLLGLGAGEWSVEERSSVAVVDELMAAFVSRDVVRIAALFTPEARFCMGPIGAMPQPMPPDFTDLGRASRIEIDVRKTCACGPIVMNDRFDRLVWPERTVSGRWIGIFEVKAGKIAGFTDYTIERQVTT